MDIGVDTTAAGVRNQTDNHTPTVQPFFQSTCQGSESGWVLAIGKSPADNSDQLRCADCPTGGRGINLAAPSRSFRRVNASSAEMANEFLAQLSPAACGAGKDTARNAGSTMF